MSEEADPRWWDFDPDHDADGSLLHAAELLAYWRDRGVKFTAYGVNLDVQEPIAQRGQVLTSADLEELDACQPLLIELLTLERTGLYNLQRTAGIEHDAVEDLSLPDPP